jgi:hypothetical protein
VSILDEIARAVPPGGVINLHPTLDRVIEEIPDQKDREALHLTVDFDCVTLAHPNGSLLLWYLRDEECFETILYRASGFITNKNVARGALRAYVIEAFCDAARACV